MKIENAPSPSLPSTFRAHTEKLCELLQGEGLLVRPYNHNTLPYFHLLSEPEQEDVVTTLDFYLKTCIRTLAEKHSLRDARFFTKKAFEELQCTFPANIFDYIQDSTVVEIYLLNQRQIFRTLRFFEVTSYSIEDIYCRQWYHLYQREQDVQSAIEKTVLDVATRGPQEIIRIPALDHILKEKDSLERLTIHNRLDWIMPLYKNDLLLGFAVLGVAKVHSS
jgi:hypothetical protein